MRFFNIILLLVVFPLGISGQTSDTDIFRQAEAQFTEKHWRTSQSLFKLFLDTYPLSALAPEGTFKLALSHYYLGQYREALKLLEQAQSRYPSTAWAQTLPFWQGLSYLGLQEWAAASGALEKALGQNDDPPIRKQSLCSLAQAQVQLGEYSKALGSLESREKEFPGSLSKEAEAGGLFLYCLSKLNLWEQILSFDRSQISTWPESWQRKNLYWQAEAQWQTGKKEKSLELWLKLTTLGPEVSPGAFSRLFTWYQEKKDTTAMESLLAKAESELGSKPEILRDFWARLGMDLVSSGKSAEALPWLKKAWAGGESGLAPGVILALSQAQDREGNRKGALEIIEKGLKSVKNGEELLYLQKGLLAMGDGQWDLGIKTFQEALKADPQGPTASQALYSQAWILVKTGKNREALNLLKAEPSPLKSDALKIRAWKLKAAAEAQIGAANEGIQSLETYLNMVPTDSSAWRDLAALHYGKKNYPQSIAAVKNAESKVPTLKSKDPGSARVLYLTEGLSHLGLGQLPEARQSLKTAAALGPDPLTWGTITYYLGSSLMKGSSPDWKGAFEAFESGLKDPISEPWLSRIWYSQGIAALSSGDPKGAEIPLRRLVEKGADKDLQTQGKSTLAKTLAAQNKIPEAVALYQRIGRDPGAGPNGAQALMDGARLLESYGTAVQVLDAYEEIFQKYPGTKTGDEALFRRGEYLLEKKDLPGALEAYKKYILNLPRGKFADDGYYFAGFCAQGTGDNQSAIFHWTVLVSDFPQSPRRPGVIWDLTNLFYKSKRYKEASQAAAILLKEYPKEAQTWGANWVSEELSFILNGRTPEEARAQVTIKKENRTATALGREAMILVARLTISGDSRRKDEGLPLVEEILAQVKDSPVIQGEAQFLLGEYWRKSGDLGRAATEYLKVLPIKSPNKDLTAQALYKAVDSLLLGNNPQQAAAVTAALEKNFPGTTWAKEARKLLEAQK